MTVSGGESNVCDICVISMNGWLFLFQARDMHAMRCEIVKIMKKTEAIKNDFRRLMEKDRLKIVKLEMLKTELKGCILSNAAAEAHAKDYLDVIVSVKLPGRGITSA